MASRVELFAPTVPAGTLESAPFVEAMAFDPGVVEGLEILVPPGPSGLVGFQILHSGEPVLPRESDRWIVSDNEPIKWPLMDMPTGAAWSFRAYNLCVYDHTIYIRLLVRELGAGAVVIGPALEFEQSDQDATSFEGPDIPLPDLTEES